MSRTFVCTLAAFAALSLAACAEKPQRVVSQDRHAQKIDKNQKNLQRERTLTQGESRRMGI